MGKLTKKQDFFLIEFLQKKNEYLEIIKKKYHIDFFEDFSLRQLENLEKILLENKHTIDNDVLYALCFIVGEIIIQELGGNWTIDTLKKDPAYNLPIILNWGHDGRDHPRLCPIEWIELFIENKLRLDGTFSKMILQNK
jgi:hypothetical protein